MSGTRERLIQQAAKHFALRGYTATSIREVTRDAGANAASAHYHFGSKAELYLEVMREFRARLSEQRNRALEAINPKLQKTRRVKAIIRAYVAPHIRLCRDPGAEHYVRIVARATSETYYPAEIRVNDAISALREKFVTALCKALPAASRDSVVKAFSFTVDLMAIAPIDTCYATLSGRTSWPQDPEELIETIVEYCTAGFIAICGQRMRNRC